MDIGDIEVDYSKNGESQYGKIIAIICTGVVLSTATVVLRIYTRWRLLHNFGPDDAVMIFAQLLVLSAAAAICLEAQFGLGKHTWVQPSDHLIPYLKSFYSSIIIYNVALCFIKISILLQFRRIFSGKMMQRLTLYGLCFFGVWTMILCLLLPLVCVPVSAFWDSTVNGRCLDSLAIWYVMASINLVTDFTIFSMPLPVVKSLQLPKRQKMMLFVVFGIGFFTCIISIIRIRTLRTAAETKDPNWDNVDAATWSFLELATAVLAACLPTLRRLFGSSFNGSHPSPDQDAEMSHFCVGPRTSHSGSALQPPTAPDSGSEKEMMGRRLRDVEEEAAPSRPQAHGGDRPGLYNVSISGGRRGSRYWPVAWSREGDSESLRALDRGGGIRTTVVLSQTVSFKEGEF